MTLEEAIAAMPHLIDDRDRFKKLVDKKPTIVLGQGKYLDEAVRILRRHQMTDIDKQTLAKCVRIAYESPEPDSFDIARNISEAYGYTVEELLKPEAPKAPEWHENIPEQGVLCWFGKDTRLVTKVVGTEDDYCMLANGFGIPLSKVIPLTDEEIESFKRGPKSTTEWHDVDIKDDADCDLGELRTRHSALSSEYRELNWAFRVLEAKFDAVVEDLNYKVESRENLIKKLVADNADLSQKRLDLVADMQLLGAVKKECEPMQLLGERPTSGYMQYTERHAGYELVYECWIREDYVIARFNTQRDAEYYCQLYNSTTARLNNETT